MPPAGKTKKQAGLNVKPTGSLSRYLLLLVMVPGALEEHEKDPARRMKECGLSRPTQKLLEPPLKLEDIVRHLQGEYGQGPGEFVSP